MGNAPRNQFLKKFLEKSAEEIPRGNQSIARVSAGVRLNSSNKNIMFLIANIGSELQDSN